MKTDYQPKLARKPHQAESVPLLASRAVANFDDPGLGKAKQAYDTAGELFAANEIDLVVAVMSASLRQNFLTEVNKDAIQFRAKVVSGSLAQRLSTYKYPGCHMLIISYETAARDLAHLQAVFRSSRVLFCLDEAHRIKNAEAKSSLACVELANLAKKVLVFTGTPAPNKAKDLFPLFKVLGHEVGESVEEFGQKFPTVHELREFVTANSIRRRKDELPDLGIPEKRIARPTVELSPEERALYDKLNDELVLEILDSFGKRQSVHIDHVLTRLLRLVQLASNPALLLGDSSPAGAKLTEMSRIVEGLLAGGEKVVLWTSFRKNVELLADRFGGHGVVTMIGGMGREELQKSVRSFQDDVKTKILVATPACAREGFTLTSACNAIYLDRNFSLLDWQQSQDRIHRISQSRPCTITVLQARGTIDEKIDAVLERKGHLQSFLVGDSDEYTGDQYLDRRAVLELLEPAALKGELV